MVGKQIARSWHELIDEVLMAVDMKPSREQRLELATPRAGGAVEAITRTGTSDTLAFRSHRDL